MEDQEYQTAFCEGGCINIRGGAESNLGPDLQQVSDRRIFDARQPLVSGCNLERKFGTFIMRAASWAVGYNER